MCRVVILSIQPIAFLKFLLPSPSCHLILPNIPPPLTQISLNMTTHWQNFADDLQIKINMLHNGLFQVFMVWNTIPLTLCSASIEFLLDIAMLSLHNYNELANLFGKGFWLTIAFSKLFTSHWLYVCIIVQQRTIFFLAYCRLLTYCIMASSNWTHFTAAIFTLFIERAFYYFQLP